MADKTNDFFERAEELMLSGEIPTDVSLKLVWSAVSATYRRLDNLASMVEDHETKISRLDWAARIIGAALLGLALKVIFGA